MQDNAWGLTLSCIERLDDIATAGYLNGMYFQISMLLTGK